MHTDTHRLRKACLVLCAWCLVVAPLRAQKPEVEDCDAKRTEARRLLRQAATLIPDTSESKAAYRMSNIVLWQARAGDAEAALQNALSIKDDSDRESARYFAGAGLASSGQAQQARQLARESKDDRRDMTFEVVAEALEERGEFQEASEAAMEIRDLRLRTDSLCSIAIAQAEGGKVKEAVATLEQVKRLAVGLEEGNRTDALGCFAYGQMKAGLLEEAQKTAGLFKSDFERANLFREIGEALAQQGRRREAAAAFDRAIEAARKANEIVWELVDPGPLKGIPAALVRAGFTDRALEVARSLRPGREQAEGLAQVVVALASQGKVKQAEKIATEIEKKFGQGAPWDGNWPPGSYGAQNLPYSVSLTHYDSISPRRAVAEAWAKKGQFDRAQRIAERIEWPSEKVLALRAIAGELGKAEKRGAAQETLRTALNFLGSLERDYDWVVMMTDVAADQGTQGDNAGAKETFLIATEFSRDVEPDKESGTDQADYLSRIAEMQAKARDVEGARATLALFRTDQHNFLFSTEEIARTQARAGDVAGAVAWVEKEKEPLAKAVGLMGVASGILESLDDAGCRKHAGRRPFWSFL